MPSMYTLYVLECTRSSAHAQQFGVDVRRHDVASLWGQCTSSLGQSAVSVPIVLVRALRCWSGSIGTCIFEKLLQYGVKEVRLKPKAHAVVDSVAVKSVAAGAWWRRGSWS